MAFLSVKDVDELIKQDPKVVEQQIIDYMISLDGLGLSRATKSLRIAAVVALYSINDIAPQQKEVNQIPRHKAKDVQR
jgi:hypothetical protein